MAAKDLTPESRQVMLECFRSFDVAGNGKIGLDDLADALRFVGIHPSTQNLKDIVRLLDKDGKGLYIEDLVEHWELLVQHSLHGDQLLEEFKKFDINNDGFINLSELKRVLTCSTGWTQEEAAQLLEELMVYDDNHDGKFSYPEFVRMFVGNSFPFRKPNVQKLSISENFTFSPSTLAKPDDTKGKKGRKTGKPKSAVKTK